MWHGSPAAPAAPDMNLTLIPSPPTPHLPLAKAKNGSREARPEPAPGSTPEKEKGSAADFLRIMELRRLSAVFQPILDFRTRTIAGYEGLIRGPQEGPFRMPAELFKAARKIGLALEFELLCRQVVLESFAARELPGKLFLNVSPESAAHHSFRNGETLGKVSRLGLPLNRVVIELTENQPTIDYRTMREALLYYRSQGLQFAIDDLGEGFASLRLWFELAPEFVKIDAHFVQGINSDPRKLQLLKSIQHVAEACGSRVIAEGIETREELMIVRDLGIDLGQGYFIDRPSPQPALIPAAPVVEAVSRGSIAVYPQPAQVPNRNATARKLLRQVEPVAPETSSEAVFSRFEAEPELHAIPVVKDGRPVGLINRHAFMEAYVRPYSRDLYGRKSCTRFMDASPLVIEKDMSIPDLSFTLAGAERRYLAEGFIITDQGKYLGLGTGQDLVREITEMQLAAARYANPLTLLPGNVPTDEHIDRLLKARARFCACYCDLDNFKPFNDAYGYRRGDELIQLAAHVLSSARDPACDFIGHIGGDDFILLLQSPDWEARCRQALDQFAQAARALFDPEDLNRGGFEAQDRQGQPVFYPLTSLSIGVVVIEPGSTVSHYEVAALASEAKKQAKRIPGNSLFVERRRPGRQTRAPSPE